MGRLGSVLAIGMMAGVIQLFWASNNSGKFRHSFISVISGKLLLSVTTLPPVTQRVPTAPRPRAAASLWSRMLTTTMWAIAFIPQHRPDRWAYVMLLGQRAPTPLKGAKLCQPFDHTNVVPPPPPFDQPPTLSPSV